MFQPVRMVLRIMCSTLNSCWRSIYFVKPGKHWLVLTLTPLQHRSQTERWKSIYIIYLFIYLCYSQYISFFLSSFSCAAQCRIASKYVLVTSHVGCKYLTKAWWVFKMTLYFPIFLKVMLVFKVWLLYFFMCKNVQFSQCHSKPSNTRLVLLYHCRFSLGSIRWLGNTHLVIQYIKTKSNKQTNHWLTEMIG